MHEEKKHKDQLLYLLYSQHCHDFETIITLSVNHKNLLFVSKNNALQKHITRCNGIYQQKQNEETET